MLVEGGIPNFFLTDISIRVLVKLIERVEEYVVYVPPNSVDFWDTSAGDFYLENA
jgi:hypothetical protein